MVLFKALSSRSATPAALEPGRRMRVLTVAQVLNAKRKQQLCQEYIYNALEDSASVELCPSNKGLI